jgi:hypothetical protein
MNCTRACIAEECNDVVLEYALLGERAEGGGVSEVAAACFRVAKLRRRGRSYEYTKQNKNW